MKNVDLITPTQKHSKSVYTTKNYELFSSIGGNRNINKLHLKRLKESMGEELLYTVILVNEKFEIIDGQHRFQALKELDEPINYIMCPNYGIEEVQRLNTNLKNWSSADYIDGYCKLGYGDYIILKDFMKSYKLPVNTSIVLLTNGISTTLSNDRYVQFKSGDFKISNLKNAQEIAIFVNKLSEIYDHAKDRSFINALITCKGIQDFDFDEFMDKAKKQPLSLVPCANKKQYLTMIEKIYNHRRRNKIRLF